MAPVINNHSKAPATIFNFLKVRQKIIEYIEYRDRAYEKDYPKVFII